MKISKFQPVVRGAAAAAIALAASFSAVPALAEAGADPTPVPAATAPATPAPVVSDAGLTEAIRRDLGMTLEEFNAAGEQAKRAADAVPSLRVLPGYSGISLKDGKIVVTGSGAELQARVDQLNQAGPAHFVLVAPAAAAPSAPAAPVAPSAAPSVARSAAELVASSTEQLFQAYVRDVGPAGLQAVAYADGHFVIRTGGINTPEADVPAVLDPRLLPTPSPARSTTAPAATTTAPAATASSTATTPALPGKISPAEFVARYANVQLEKGAPIKTEEDLYGGQGYVIEQLAICSAGFGAFSPAGLPVVLTAGHCAGDGPAKKPADFETPSASTAGGATTPLKRPLAPLGTFGFSQFGGLNNSWITGTQASPGNVGTDIAVIELLRAGVTVQPAATKWDNVANPGPTAVKIIGMVSPFQGQAVCRSGRTTGWSCGTVNELGIYIVGGATSNIADLRAFRGFLSKDVQSSGGDSGGPWVSGNYAVGTHSAGDAAGSAENFAIATTLEDSIAQIPGGVQLQLFLNKPELVAPANGTFTAGTPVTGRVPAAPASAVAANSKVRITVVGQPPLEVPLDAAGNWSFPAPLSTGRLQFSAETVNGFSRSGAASLSVNVSDLAVPVITKPLDGAELKAVDSIDGTGTPGLTVLLSGGVTGSGVVAPDGRWSIPLAGRAVYGKVSVTAVQTAPGHEDSPSATQSFTVVPPAPASAPATFTIDPATVLPAAARPAGDAGGSGQLANTGAGALLPAVGVGAGALALGGALLVFGRRRACR